MIIIPFISSVCSPNVLYFPIINRITIVHLAFFITWVQLRSPLQVIQFYFALAAYRTEAIKWFIASYSNTDCCFFAPREPIGEKRHELFKLHAPFEERKIINICYNVSVNGVISYPCFFFFGIPAHPVRNNLWDGITQVYRETYPPPCYLGAWKHTLSKLNGVWILSLEVYV